MTVDEVEARVEKIRVYAEQENDEAAHEQQDMLFRHVLESISSWSEVLPAECHPVAVAKAALAVKSIDFRRWYE